MKAPPATSAMLAHLSSLRVLAAALAEADAVEAQTMLDVRKAVGLVDVADLPSTTRDAVAAARSTIIAEAQRAARERRRIRRDGLASEIDRIGRELRKLGETAEAELAAVAHKLRVDTLFVPGQGEMLGRVA